MERSIQKPVGDGPRARNLYDDVVTIQQLLNEIAPANAGANPPLKVDGICGPKTKKAIQTFQLQHFGWKLADARIDPGGATLAKMNTLAVPDYESIGFRMRRFQDDSKAVPASEPQIFHVQYLEFGLRNAMYSFSAHPFSVSPASHPMSLFKGGWNAFTTRQPTSIRRLGCKARQSTTSIEYPTRGEGIDEYYKVKPTRVMEFYLTTGAIYVPIGFETELSTWGQFAYAGELS